LERTVEAISPEMRAVGRVDELRRDADPSAGLADRAFKHIPHAKVAADPPHIGRPSAK
jgi:hypothetical protein